LNSTAKQGDIFAGWTDQKVKNRSPHKKLKWNKKKDKLYA
jgi:hypothetical protein